MGSIDSTWKAKFFARIHPLWIIYFLNIFLATLKFHFVFHQFLLSGFAYRPHQIPPNPQTQHEAHNAFRVKFLLLSKLNQLLWPEWGSGLRLRGAGLLEASCQDCYTSIAMMPSSFFLYYKACCRNVGPINIITNDNINN